MTFMRLPSCAERFRALRYFTLLVTASALVAAVSPASAHADARYALVVGHNRGLNFEEPLRYAERDAERMAEVLQQLGRVKSKRLRLLRHPSVSALRAELTKMRNRLANEREPRTSLIFYYAGHGDEKSLHLGNERISREVLKRELEGLKAHLTVAVIDACATSGRLRGVLSAPAFEVEPNALGGAKGVALIQSSRGGEPSIESDRLQSAVFSHHLLSGLRGAADTDQNDRVTLQEAYTYAYHRTLMFSTGAQVPEQRPTYELQLAGYGDVVLSYPKRAKLKLTLSPDLPGTYYFFRTPQGTVAAEARVGAHPVAVGLPRAGYTVHRWMGEQVWVAQVRGHGGGERVLRKHHFHKAAPEEVRMRGGSYNPRPHHLGLAALGSVERFGSRALLRYGASTSYSFIAFPWVWHIGAEGWHSAYSTDHFSVREHDFVLLGGLGRQLAIGGASLTYGADAAFGLRLQSRQRTDADTLRSLNLSKQDALKVAAFPSLRLRLDLDIPLSDAWAAYASAQLKADFLSLASSHSDEGQLTIAPGAIAQVGVRLRL